MSRIFTLLVLCSVVLLSETGVAQYFHHRRTEPPEWIFLGTAGNTNHVGTDGSDSMRDNYLNDTDVFHDSPGGPDGEPDYMDCRDGDSLDRMYGGVEDEFKGDDCDLVFIRVPGRAHPIWQGKVREYRRLQAVFRWIRDQWQLLAPAVGPGGNLDLDRWEQVILDVRQQLQGHSPQIEEGETVAFDEVFQIGPYEIGEVMASPLDCLNWLPFLTNDPVQGTSEVTFTKSEYLAAVQDALALVDYLSGADLFQR